MADDPAAGREVIVTALEKVAQVNQAYPNSMIIQMFINTKSREVIEIFKVATLEEQNKVINLMSQIDPSNSANYRAIR
jgi:hypothetical protein